jgi:hypothetical protein
VQTCELKALSPAFFLMPSIWMGPLKQELTWYGEIFGITLHFARDGSTSHLHTTQNGARY